MPSKCVGLGEVVFFRFKYQMGLVLRYQSPATTENKELPSFHVDLKQHTHARTYVHTYREGHSVIRAESRPA